MSQLQEKRDREMAMQLQQSYENELDLNDCQIMRRDVRPESPHQQEIHPFTLKAISGMISKPFTTESQQHRSSEEKYNSPMTEYQYPQVASTPEKPSQLRSGRENALQTKAVVTNDSALARALQAMEFEMADETLSAREGGYRNTADDSDMRDYNEKELQASSCKRQLATLSTFICVIQICFLVAMIQQDGYAPRAINPMIGPPATTLVRYGGKYAGLIVYEKQWWRLISPIAVHAGIIHLLSNVIIQLRVGGYLNLVYGTWKWFLIYLLSGIYGEILSCIVLPDPVGVGSSGAVLGMLASWIVWILFRWKKIPEHCRKKRNCQMSVVVLSVVITLATSAAPFVDWGAHLGGAIMGTLIGCALLSNELENKRHALAVRLISSSCAAALFIACTYYVAVLLHPTSERNQYFLDNNKWSK